MQTIFPLSTLPAITNPVLIDGFFPTGLRRHAAIELNGSQAGAGDGLTITGPNVTVRGLDINNFCQGAGIHLTGPAPRATGSMATSWGPILPGTQAEPNEYGVEIDGGAASEPDRDQRRRGQTTRATSSLGTP